MSKSKFDEIALVGVQAYRPATEYGYIEYGNIIKNNIYKVTNFHEKPSREIVRSILRLRNVLWNTGIFCAKVSVFLSEFSQYAPELMRAVENYLSGDLPYESVPECSFDVAVLEKSKKCV